MTQTFRYPFRPEQLSTNSSQTSFVHGTALESSHAAIEATGVREWIQGPVGRAIRVSETSGIDYNLEIGGSSDVVADSTSSMLMLGGTVEILQVRPGDTHIAIRSVSTTTGAAVNITLGRGQ